MIGLVISAINVVLETIVEEIFGKFEKKNSFTSLYISCAKKIGIAQFINTSVIVVLVNYIMGNTEIWAASNLFNKEDF